MTDAVNQDRKRLLGDDHIYDRVPDEASTEELMNRTSTLNEVSLEGDIDVHPLSAGHDHDELDTLDEPIMTTVLRDVKAVGVKFYHVLYPKKSLVLLREWDLWGPFFLCIFMAIMLQENHSTSKGPEFAQIFVVYWLGAAVVTLNIKLLGGCISFLQSVCVLGYCVLPLAFAVTLSRLILLAQPQTVAYFVLRCIFVLCAFVWSILACTAFMAGSQPARRKALALYPVCLFYFILAWLVLSQTRH